MLSVPTPGDGAVHRLRQICADAARDLAAAGSGISVATPAGRYSPLTAADATSEKLEEMQFVLGEGPWADAARTDRPVLVSDLDTGEPRGRWPLFCSAMNEAGIRAAFAFPLQLGAARLGVLDVFRSRPGSLSRSELGAVFDLTGQAVTVLLEFAVPDVDVGMYPPDEASMMSAELYQAQGMVMVQLDCTLPQAMARIRAHAYAEERRLVEVTRDIVGRRLRLDRDE